MGSGCRDGTVVSWEGSEGESSGQARERREMWRRERGVLRVEKGLDVIEFIFIFF